MKLNQLIVGRIYKKVTGNFVFVRVIYKNVEQNVLLIEVSPNLDFNMQSTTRHVLGAIVPTNAGGQFWPADYEPYIPQVTKFFAVLQHVAGGAVWPSAFFDTENDIRVMFDPNPDVKILKVSSVSFDDPNYVEPEAEDEDATLEI